MNGEFIGIETLEEITSLKRENKRLKELKLSNDKNVLDANIKLQDENNMLKRDIQILEKRFDEATKYVERMIKELDKRDMLHPAETELLGILKGE